MTEQELKLLAQAAYDDPYAFLIAGIHNVGGINKLRKLAKGI